MAFQFIDNSSIDGATRKRIRSHAALGKNAGKTLNRPSRKNAQRPRVMTATALVRVPKAVRDTYKSERNEPPVPELERQIDDGICFPVELAAESRQLARQVFHFLSGPRFAPELNNAVDCTGTTVSIWVQLMLVDEAYFHCALALSISALNKLLLVKKDSTSAMQHLSQTFHIISQRLSGNRAVSNETIAAVVGMAQYERHHGEHSRGLVHVRGLWRMVQLRGGIAQLAYEKPSLTQKIFRVDLEYALQLGTRPLFTSKDVEVGRERMYGPRDSFKRPKEAMNKDETSLLSRVGNPLWELLLEMRHAAFMVNESSANLRPKLNSFEFHDALIKFGYKILAINPLGGNELGSLEASLLHLGLAAFLMSFLRGLDRLVAETPLLSKLASIAGQTYEAQGSECQRLLLWFLLIGRSSIFRGNGNHWQVSQIRLIIQSLGLQTWDEVKDAVAIFPWVDCLHNEPSRYIWEMSQI
ncbi:hypothetical protein BGZ63DRAFT_271394 [Mariannaea sp. PMI_226]|nr:hypothetical protein BGZ63DRAFT_271394 [Mariannaea sp. PMI_226]